MKTFITLLAALFLVLPLGAEAATILKTPNNLGLVGYWPLNEGSGSSAKDKSGQGNNGAISGASWTTGKYDKGLSFNGSSNYVQTVNNSGISATQARTISFWAKSNITDYSAHGYVVNLNSLTAGANTMFGVRVDSGDTWRFTDGATGRDTGVAVTTNWTYVVVTLDSSQNLNFYINGVLTSVANINLASINTAVGPVTIGALDPSFQYFNGLIDDIRLYNRALSATEVANLYTLGQARAGRTAGVASGAPLTNGLVGHWTLDGKDTNWATGRTIDASGNGNTGQLTSMATTTTPVVGKFGQAFDFDGSDDYVNVTTSGSLNFNGATNISMSAWVKRDVISDGNGRIITKMSTDGYLLLVGNDGKVDCYADTNSGSNSHEQQRTADALPIGVWKFVTCTFAVGSDDMKIYINGVSQSLTAVSHGGGSSIVDDGTTLQIGNVTANNRRFKGVIDDVRIYNRVLSASEVQQLYAMGSAGANAGHSVSGAGATNAGVPLSAGLVGYWTMDGSTINWATGRMTDRSGQGNTGTLVSLGTTTSPVAGKIGQALNFNGSNSQLAVANNISFGSSNFTLAAWFKTAHSGDTMQIWNSGYDGNQTDLELALSGDDVQFFARDVSDNTAEVAAGSTFTDGRWHHAVATRSGTTFNVYVDGILRDSTTAALGSVDTVSVTPMIGNGLSTINNRWFNGALDDVRVYNRALSASEVMQLYKLGK